MNSLDWPDDPTEREEARQWAKRAWQEGYEQGVRDHCDYYGEHCPVTSPNPYLSAVTNDPGW